MATFISVDDVHANIKIVSGLCPEDPVTILVDNYLGGGGNPNNYYYNWFVKDPVDTNEYSYTTTARFEGGVNTIVRIPAPGSDPTNQIVVNELNLNIDFRPGGTFDVFTPVIAALSGFGRTFFVGVGYLDIFMLDSDPLLVNVLSTGQATVSYWTALDVQYGYNQPIFTAGNFPALFTRLIKGWIPLADGVNADTFIVPSNTGIYMVEVVDEVGTPDYGVIDLNILIPACGFEKTNVSCAGKNDGSLVVLPFFDNSVGITFAWTKDEVEYSTQKDIYNLAPGTYCLTMTNSNGCQRTCCETITEPLPLEITVIRQTNPSCVSCRNSTRFGELLVEITGGNIDCADACNSPYEYSLDGKSWSKVDFDNRILLTRLTEGSYKLYVRDCKCCFAFHEFIIEEQRVEIS